MLMTMFNICLFYLFLIFNVKYKSCHSFVSFILWQVPYIYVDSTSPSATTKALHAVMEGHVTVMMAAVSVGVQQTTSSIAAEQFGHSGT